MPTRRFRSAALIACGLAALAVTACSPIVDQRGNLPDQAKLDEIKPGVTTKEAVSQLLGTPSSVSTFNDKTWYYISRRTEQVAFFEPEVKQQDVVAIAFDDSGVVRDVARRNLADSRFVDPSARETPAPGHELGFFEQLLGNVGRFNTDKSSSKPKL